MKYENYCSNLIVITLRPSITNSNEHEICRQGCYYSNNVTLYQDSHGGIKRCRRAQAKDANSKLCLGKRCQRSFMTYFMASLYLTMYELSCYLLNASCDAP